jgi:hypothetical protein
MCKIIKALSAKPLHNGHLNWTLYKSHSTNAIPEMIVHKSHSTKAYLERPLQKGHFITASPQRPIQKGRTKRTLPKGCLRKIISK